MELTTQIFELVLIPLLAALTGFLVKWIKTKTDALKAQTNHQITQKYIDMLDNTITNCVIATNQTYVNSLKNKEGKLEINAQKEAFQKTFEAVQSIITDEMNQYLQSAIGDVNTYITSKIETEVYLNKKPE